MESRNANKFDLLIELLICDRIKSQLSEGALFHILGIENQYRNGWLHLDKLVESLDVFYTCHSVFYKPRWTATAVSGGKHKPPRPPPPVKNTSANAKIAPSLNKTRNEKYGVKRCFTCGSDQHLANFHKSARVNRCKVDRDANAVRSGACAEY